MIKKIGNKLKRDFEDVAEFGVRHPIVFSSIWVFIFTLFLIASLKEGSYTTSAVSIVAILINVASAIVSVRSKRQKQNNRN